MFDLLTVVLRYLTLGLKTEKPLNTKMLEE